MKNIPFVTSFYENTGKEKVVKTIHSKLSNIQSGYVSEIMKNNVINSQKQLKNLRWLLTKENLIKKSVTLSNKTDFLGNLFTVYSCHYSLVS